MPLTETQKQALRQKFPRLFEGQPSGLLLEPEPPTAASRLTDDQRNELRRKFGLPGAPPEPKPPGFLSRVTSSILSALPALGTGEPVAEVALPAEAELPSLADLPVPPAIPLGRIKQALLEAPRADEAEPTAFSRVGRKVQEAVLSLFPTEEEFQTGPVGRLRVAMGIQVLAPGEKTPADVMGARKEITQAEKVLAPVAFPIIMALKTAEVGVRAMFAPVVGFLAGLHQGFVELGMSETDAARAVKDVEAGFISLIATGTPIPRGPYRLSGLREPKVDLATMSFDDFVRLAEETGGYSGLLRELRRKSPERFEEIRELLRERSRGGFEAGKEASSKAREPVAAIPGEVLPAAPVAAPVAAEIARPAPAPAPPAVRPAIPGPEGTVAAPTVPGAVQAPPAPTVPAKALGLRDRILAEVPEAGVRVTGELAKTIGVSQKELIPVLQELDREGGILVFTPGPTPNAGVVQRHSPRTVEVIEPVTEEILRAVRSRVQQEGATNLYNLATELRVSPRTIQEAVESLAGEGFKVSRRAVRVEGERAWDVMIEGPRAVKGQPGQLYVLHQGEQYPIESLEDASKKFTALVKAAEAGAGDVPDTVIVDESGAVVGYIAYNGRIFPGRSEEWKPGLKPLYDPRQEAGRVPQLGEAPPPEPPALQPGTTPLPEPKVARPAKPPVPAKPKPPEAEPLPSGVTEQEVFDRIQAIRRTTEDIRSGAEPGRVVIFDPEALTEGRKRPIGAIAGQGKILDLVAEVFDEVSAVQDVAPKDLVEAIKKDKENPIYQRLKRAVADQIKEEVEEGKVTPALSGRALRESEIERLSREQATKETEISRGIAKHKPLGRLSDLGAFLGGSTKPNQETVGTPHGTFVFRKGQGPSEDTVKGWETLHQQAEALGRQVAELAASGGVIEPNRTIGNKVVLERMQKAKARGMLDPDELEFLGRLERFWEEHPEADSGVVREDGTIEPIARGKPKEPEKPTPTFEIGDMVRAKPSLEFAAGQVGRVQHIKQGGRLKVEGVTGSLYFSSEDFEKVEPEAVPTAPAPGDAPTPVTPEGEVKPVPPKETPPQEASRLQPLVQAIADRIRRGTLGDNAVLRALVDQVMGGTIAQGVWDYQDAYDALETAANIVARERGLIVGGPVVSTRIREARELQDSLTKLSARTVERVTKQQFSTPLTVAQLVAELAQVRPGEVVLEPSAGTGALLAPLPRSEVTYIVNELAPRRRDLLRLQGFEPTATDALRLYQGRQEADVVVMNPPWKSGVQLGEEFRSSELAAFHVAQALRMLRPGGRLVAVVPGRSFVTGEAAGFAPGAGQTRDFFRWVRERYTVRANVDLPGEEYGTKGSEIPFQILVVDNVGPEVGDTPPALVARFLTVEEAAQALSGLAKRPQGPILVSEAPSHARTAPVGQPAVPPRQPVGAGLPGEVGQQPRTPGVRGPGLGRLERPGGPGLGRGPLTPGPAGGLPPATAQPQPTGGLRGVAGAAPLVPAGGIPGGVTAGLGGEVPRRAGPVPEPGRPEDLAGGPGERTVGAPEPRRPTLDERVREVEPPQGEGALVPYQPTFQQGQRHPTLAMEPRSLSGVSTPPLTVELKLPRRLIDSGTLSREQLDTVGYAMQTHELKNPDGARRGFWLADMTGFGKGRQLAAVIYENALRGNRRAVWVSASSDLLKDAVRDLQDLKVPLPVHEMRRVKAEQALPWSEGVVFVNYDLVKSKDKKGNRRLDQLLRWLQNYQPGGVLVLDEIHRAKNAVTMGGLRQATQTGLSMIELQTKLPNSRVIYSTATAVTEPINMGYMVRLGMWGPGTPFVGDDLEAAFKKFVLQMNEGGLGIFEALVRDLKSMGQYLGRSISFGQPDAPLGQRVEYAETIHDLTPEQARSYDMAAEVWNAILREGIEAAKIVTGETTSKAQKALQIRNFWSAHQRFFKTLTAAFKLPTVVRRTEELLASGHSVVISLIQTREQQQNQAVKDALAEERTLEDIDLSPRQGMLNFIDRFIPVNQMSPVTNEATGAVTGYEVLRDATGGPVVNHVALERRERLKQKVGDFAQTENPLDAIIKHFGERNVAEMSGRKKRLRVNPITNRLEVINRRVEGAKAKDVNNAERDAIQMGRKRVALITSAASTGISLHDDPRSQNAQRRVMLMMELDWSADTNLQRMGRVHRAGQRTFPIIELVTSSVGGEKRFASTVARRLASLGALSRGQRQAVSAGEIAKYDFESSFGNAAVDSTLSQLMRSGSRSVLERMGFLKSDARTGNEYLKDDVDVPSFLNRLLSLDVRTQNEVFEIFAQHFDRIIEQARQSGVFDEGVRTLRGVVKSETIRQETLLRDPDTKAETRYVEVALSRPLAVTPLKEVQVREGAPQIQGEPVQPGDFVVVTRGEELGLIVNAFPRDHQRPISRENVRYAVAKPTGLPSFVLPTSIKSKISPEVAKSVWDREVEQGRGKLVEERRHLITGRIIPIYDKIVSSVLGERTAEEVDVKLQVLQLDLSDGSRVVGYDIPSGRIDAVLDALKLERGAQAVMTPEEAFAFVLDGKEFRLSNDIAIRRERFQGEEVLAVKGLSTSFRQKASEQWELQVFQDPGGRWRFFVPKVREQGVPALGKLMREFPQPAAKTRGAPGKPPGQRDAERRGVEPEDPEVSTRRVAAPTAPTPTSPLHRGWKPPSSPQAAHAKEMKKADIIRTLSEGLGVPIRVGKFRQRALGVFKRHPRVIRLRNVNDVATAAHEVGHYLQRVFFHLFGSKALSAVRAEVESLAIPGGPPFNEGFAEFTRLYVTDPAAVQSRAPNLLAAFDRALHAEAPEVLGILLEARDMLDRWENQPGRARVRAQIHFGTETKHLSIPQMWDRFQTAVLDDLHHIEVAERELLQGLPEIPADQKPYLLGRVSRGQEFGIAEVFLKHGLVDFETLGVSGKALQPIYQEAERLVLSRGDELDKALAKQGLALRVLDEYLVARRVPNLLRRKRKTGIRLEDARDTLRALEYLEPVAAELDAYQKAVSKFVRDSYGVSDAEWAPIEEANEHYAPFYRFIEDEYLGAMGVMARKGFADQPRFFRRLKGSEREILPPTESILKNTYAMIHMAVRNNVAAALVNLAGRREGQGYLVEKVPAQMKPTSFELERIRKALEEAGFDVTKEEGNLSVVATVFTPTKQPGKNEIGVWLGGKKQFFEIGDEWLWRSMTALDRKAADAFVRLLQLPVVKQLVVGPARLRRATATTFSPEFILRNPLRDNLEAFLLAEFGFRPGLDLWRGVMHMVNADETWQAWLAGGGPMATVVSMDRLKLQQTVQTLLERGLAKKAMKVVRNPLEGLRAISEAMELGTRLGVFDKSLREIERRASGRSKPLPTAQEALDSLREMGKSREALVEAGLASREATIDFGRMGLYTRGLSMMTAFWNAGVQGLDRFRRAFRDHPGRTFKRGAVLTVASLLVYLANRDDEDYYRLPTWRRGTGWNLKIGGTWWWLPTPWLGGLVFAIVPTRMFEFVDRQDRRILDRVADDVTRSIDVIPFLNAWPTVLEPFVENFANWKFFFDRPIVPRALEGVDPVFQATRETSEVSKAISKALNEVGVGYPPAKIDNVILSWTAALGRVGLQAIDAAVDRLDKGPPRPSPTLADLPVVRAFVQRYPTMQAQPIVDFWELFRDVEQAARSVRLLEREGRGEELARFQDRNRERLALFQFLAEKGGVHDQMQELRKGMDEVDRSVSVSPEEKRVRLDRLILASIRVAEAGLAGSELIRGRMREHRAVAPKKVAERLGTTPATPRAPELRRPEASP